MNTQKIRTGLVLAAILTTSIYSAACASTIPPNELVTARSNYARASQSRIL